MQYKSTKDVRFSASHILPNLPEGHLCSRLHGHNYIVRITLGGKQLNDNGRIEDTMSVIPWERHIQTKLDGTHLNDTIPLPTPENLAAYLLNLADEYYANSGITVISVAVSQTDKCWVTAQHEEDVAVIPEKWQYPSTPDGDHTNS